MVDGRCKREATVANLEQFPGPEGGITVPQVLDCDTFFWLVPRIVPRHLKCDKVKRRAFAT
jgi:hypothetical protein